MEHRSELSGFLFAALLLCAAAADAQTPASSCAARKLKAAGKQVSTRLGCERKAAKAGGTADSTCLDAASAKLQATFADAEQADGCLVRGDEMAVEARVDAWESELLEVLRPALNANDCVSAKLRATAKKIVSTLRCYVSALKKNVPADAECLAKAEEKLTAKFEDAETKDSCLTTGDATSVADRIDQLTDALRFGQRTGCIVGAVTGGDSVRTMSIEALTRTYHLHLPPGYQPGQPTPLVFSFHGGTGSATQQAFMTGLHGKSDSAGFLLIEPEGSQAPSGVQTWNAGNCCGSASANRVDDVGFVNRMIDSVGADACIDPQRVFATGHSNGSMLSHRLACELSDRIAAIAPNSGGIGDVNQDVSPAVAVYTCASTRPVPVFEMHGDADTCYNFNGGVGTGFSGVNFISVPATIGGWIARNGCSNATNTTYQNQGATCNTYQGCAAGADVTLCLLHGHGHAWPGGTIYLLGSTCGGVMSSDLIANDALWDFFTAHPMP